MSSPADKNKIQPKKLTVDTLPGFAKAESAFLLSERCVSWAITLTALELARAKRNLVDAKVRGATEWVQLVKKTRDDARRSEREAPRGDEEDWRGKLLRRKDEVCESVGNLCILLRNLYAGRLALNLMGSVPFLDGKQLEDATPTRIREELEQSEGLIFPSAMTKEAIQAVAAERSYHPVRAYLESLQWDGTPRLASVARRHFGATDRMSSIYIGRTAIAAVARAMDSGCKVDTVCVLTGDEGLKKSTFWSVLGGEWFRDSDVDITDRKGKMTMHSSWVFEWAEVDKMLEQKSASAVKAFTSVCRDDFVPMYGTGNKSHARGFVIVATTNKEKFIVGATGDRRIWTVPVAKRADETELRAERDQLWAEAAHYYRLFLAEQAKGVDGDANPYRWWLNQSEDELRATRNEEHRVASPAEERIDAWLSGDEISCGECKGHGRGFGDNPCPSCGGHGKLAAAELHTDDRPGKYHGRRYVTVAEVLSVPLGVPQERHSKNVLTATDALRQLGWRAGTRFVPPGGRAKITPYYEPIDPANDDGREP